MKSSQGWNRRDFIAKPAALLAATQLLGPSDASRLLFGQAAQIEPEHAGKPASSKPIYRTLGKTKIKLPIVSMGVMNADVPGLVHRSYEIGVRHFDTAAGYQQGRNEQMVGQVIKEMGVRDQVIISTKIPHPRANSQGSAQAAAAKPGDVKAHFLGTFDGCLKRLQMDYVDILYNHACDSEETIRSEEALEAFTQLKKQGKVRFIGVSSHQPEMALKLVMKLGVHDVVLLPINYTMADNRDLLNLIDQAAASGIGIIAMKTQAGGATRPAPKLNKPLTESSQTALLKWVLRHPAITTAIPGYTTYEQMEQNFSVASRLEYTPAEQEFLSNRTFAAEAQFCRQCRHCVADCPQGVDIPLLMRSHMYAVQYANYSLAAQSVAAIEPGRGLDACQGCADCRATCRNSVNIPMKIRSLMELAAIGRVNA